MRSPVGVPSRSHLHCLLVVIITFAFSKDYGHTELTVQPSRVFGGQRTPLHLTPTGEVLTKAYFRDRHCEAFYSLTFTSKPVQGRVTLELKDGRAEGIIDFDAPVSKEPTKCFLSVSVAPGSAAGSLWIFPPLPEGVAPAFAGPWVVYVDAPLALKELAEKTNAKAHFVVGGAPLPPDWRVAVVSGNRIAGRTLLSGTWGERALKDCGHILSIVCNGENQRPVDAWRVGWGKVNQQLQTYLTESNIPEDWMKGWKDGRGMPLPSSGNFCAFASSSLSDSQEVVSPLLGFPAAPESLSGWDKGWSFHCSLPLLESLSDDPTAGGLLVALVYHSAMLAWFQWPLTPAVALADPATPTGASVAGLCSAVATDVESIPQGQALLVDANSSDPNILRLARALGKKNMTLLLGLTPENLGRFDWLLPEGSKCFLRAKPSRALDSQEARGFGAIPHWPYPYAVWGWRREYRLTEGLCADWYTDAIDGERVWTIAAPSQSTIQTLDAYGAGLRWQKEETPVMAWQLPVRTQLGQAALRHLLTNLGVEVR